MARKTNTKQSSRAPRSVGRLPIKQPPHPIASVRINHGVSGFQTTGVPGAFNAGFSTPGVAVGNLDPRASRMDIQASGNVINIRTGNNNYNQSTPGKVAVIGQIPYSNLTSEPIWTQRFAGGTGQQTVSFLPRNDYLQSQGGASRGSFMDQRAAEGYYGNDMFLQHRVPNLDRNRPVGASVGDQVTPLAPTRLDFHPRPSAPARQGDQHSGTINQPQSMEVATPMGQVSLHYINDSHTPQPATAGYASAGTHPAHGPTPSSAYDGSWTLDILPGGQQQPGLSDLPPAADIPVQTYSGSGPRSTSIYASRPLGSGISNPRAHLPIQVGAY